MTNATITAESDHRRDDSAAGRVFVRACAAEWTRLWTVRSTWGFLAAAAVVMVGLGTALGLEAGGAEAPEPGGDSIWTPARFITMPAQLALLGLALTAVTSDYATGGIVPALQWTPRRTILFSARVLVTVLVVAAAGVLLAACGLVAFGTAGSGFTQPLDEALNLLCAAAFVFASGTALAVGLGFLLRTTAGALITVFLLMLVLTLLLSAFGGWISTLGAALPGSGAAYLLVGEPSSMTTASSITVLLAWAAGILLLGWLRLTLDDANR